MHIGHIPLANRLLVAPMAGVTDRPFRQLCKRLGAGYAVSEMVTPAIGATNSRFASGIWPMCMGRGRRLLKNEAGV